MQLQQEVNDAVGGFGRSVAEVKKKWVCREFNSEEGERGSSETAKRDQRSQDRIGYQ